MLKRTVTSLIATSISSVLAVDIQTAPPPDGIVPFGINSELAPLIQDLVTTPIQAVRYQKIVESGNGFTFDFINSPVNLFNGKGGTFTLADDSDYPGGIGSGMASVVLVLAPCAMIQPHYQPRANEIGYLISGGPMRWATQFEAGGPLDYEFLQVGQALMLPKGSMHYGLVLGCDPTLVLAAFDVEDPGFNLVPFAFWGFDDEAIAASEGTYGVQPVDFSQFPQPLNLGAQQCLDRCGIDRSAFDVGQTTKLQLMQASFTAYAKRVLAGNLSTFEPLPDLDLTQTTRTNQGPYSNYGIPEVATAASGPGSISGASTIGNLSGVDYTKQNASGSGNKVQGSVSDPMANNVNHVDPSAWMAGRVNLTGTVGSSVNGVQRSGALSGFASDNGSGGDSSELKSYRIATYVLAASSAFFLSSTIFLFYAVSKQRKSGQRLGGGSSRPLMTQAFDS